MRWSKTLRALAAMLAITACFRDLHLAAADLQIGPNPAVPGDVVVASVVISVVPVQRHTVRVMIDDKEHVALTSTERPEAPTVITIGNAADLIAAYGVGAHTVFIQVRAEDADRTARTRSVDFELRQATP